MLRALLPLAVAAAASAGCSEEERPAAPPPAPAADVEVRMTLPAGPVYMEGSVPRLRIEREDGEVVFEQDVRVTTLDRPLLRRRLPAGRYRLHSVQLPCQGNCDYLEEPHPDSRCTAEFVVAGIDQVVELVLERTPDGRMHVACAARPA